MGYLADVNFLVALLHASHEQSARAARWLEDRKPAPSIGLCHVTQIGLLRVLTNRSWLKSEVRSAAEVWSAWDALLADDRFVFLAEPSRLDREWRRLTGSLATGKMVETDSYLAAFARSARLTLLTFDAGVRRFPGLAVEVPT